MEIRILLRLLALWIYVTVSIATNPCCNNPAYPVLKCEGESHVVGVWECTCENGVKTGEKFPPLTSTVGLVLHNVSIANLAHCLRTIANHSTDSDVIAFTSLREIKIDGRDNGNDVITLKYSRTFPVFPSLSKLNLQNLGINFLHLNFFAKFSSISDVVISGNNLATLEFEKDQNNSETLPIHSLNSFNVSNNNIDVIKPETFDLMTSLESLDLSYNDLETIPDGIFSKLNMLSQLYLQGNRLVTITGHVFQGLYQLTSLDLQYNDITDVDFSEKIFFNMTSSMVDNEEERYALQELTVLDLSFNKISRIENISSFSILSQLDFLNLSNNHLEMAPLSPFLLLCNLQTLDLTSNKISRVESHVEVAKETCFVNALATEALESNLVLDLSFNQISKLGNLTFSNIPWLSSIKLNSNNIIDIEEIAFKGIPLLKELHLSGNLLQEFDARILNNLTYLDLSNNLLTQVSRSWVDAVSPDREGQLNLGGNRLVCDHKMEYLFAKASCNEISEKDLYSQTSIDQLNDFTEAFNNSANLTLPSPGLCTVLVSSEECAMRLGSDFNKCLFRSYLDLARVSKNLTGVFEPLLDNLEILFHYARIASDKFSDKELAKGRENIIYALNNIAGTLYIDNGHLIGYIGGDVIMGISDITSQRRTRSIPHRNPGLGFSLTNQGNGMFLQSLLQYRMSPFVQSACNATFNGKTTSRDKSQMEILLPTSLYNENNGGKITFAVYKDNFLFPTDNELKTPIISADVFDKNINNLQEPVVITATINVDYNVTDDVIMCSFWDFKISNWSSEGCSLFNFTLHKTEPLTATVTCHCEHLTNFGILLDYNPTVNKDTYDYVISYISYVGLIASITGLVITIIYRLSNRELRRGVPQIILLHLCFTLLLLYLSLIINDTKFITSNKGLCFSIGIITHFSLLSVWGWAVTEAVSMYLLLVRVYNVNLKNFLTKSTLLCYGVALLLVGASLFYSAMRTNFPSRNVLRAYSKGGLCFPTSPNHWYFVIAPIAMACLLNCTLFVFIVVALNRTAKSEASGDKKRVIKNRLRQAICITALLGVTWVFGFLKIFVEGLWGETGRDGVFVIDILFATCNSIQGFVIFLMFCATKIWEESRCTKTLQRLQTDSFAGRRWTSSAERTESTNTSSHCNTKV